MSYYPNGRGTYSQHDQYGQPYQPYGTQGQQLRRNSSFDAGDDRASPNDGRQGQQYAQSNAGPAGYGMASPSAQYGHGVASQQQQLPLRGQSYRIPTASGPQSHTASSPEPLAYNPQHYSHTQTPQQQYIPQFNSSPSNFMPQAYNPAAYQPSNHSSSGLMSPIAGQFSYDQPPPPPPRPHAYSVHQTSNLGTYNSLASPTTQHPSSAPLPPPRPSAYSPSAPPSQPSRDGRSSVYQSYSSHSHRVGSSGQMTDDDDVFDTPPTDYPSPPSYTVYGNSSFSDRANDLDSRNSPRVPPNSSPGNSHEFNRVPQRTDTLTRHPQARPLPGPPPESDSESEYLASQNQPHTTQQSAAAGSTYEDLMKEIEIAVMDRAPSNRRGSSRQGIQPIGRANSSGLGQPTPPDRYNLSPDERFTHTNGQLEATGAGQYVNYGAFSDDSDAEAAAGLAAMQEDDEREAAEKARRSGSTSLFDAYGRSPSGQAAENQYHSRQESSSDSDYKVDMSLIGGGYDAHLHYDDNPSIQGDHSHGRQVSNYENYMPRMNSIQSSDLSTEGRRSRAESFVPMPEPEFGRPLPPIHADASTGGLTEPSLHPRRMSFEDGDEAPLLDSAQSPSKESIPDLFYHPGMTSRPLPPAPIASSDRIPHLLPAGTYLNGPLPPLPAEANQPSPYPVAADAYETAAASAVPRSTSMASSRSTPRVDQPMRSKTDADKARAQRQVGSGRESAYDTPQPSVSYDLPVLKKSFNPEKISPRQFDKCNEPWALGSIVQWLKWLAADADYLKDHGVTQAMVLLFTYKVPTMNTTEAEKLGDKVVKDMFSAGVLVREEEWVRIGTGDISGVLYQLTGQGCYAPKLHTSNVPGKCYSHHCMRTWRRVDLSQQMPAERKAQDWATFYGLKKDDIEGKDKKEIERQNILHEIITTEDGYMDQLDVLRRLYRDQLKASQPPIIPSKRFTSFMSDVFGPIDGVKKVNEDYLLGQLKYRQQEQGPWIVGFSDIFREWIRKAKNVYIHYASGFPRANYLVRQEAARNIAFRNFLDQARENRLSNRLSWDTYLKGPITRLQRYGLLLQTVHKNMRQDSAEKLNLQFAVDEVRAVTFECNAKVDEMTKKIELLELSHKLKLRKGMDKVQLNLDHLGREIILQGDLLRAGGRGLQWVETRCILFDHYLVLAKVDSQRDTAGGLKYERYDVSKMPIPMDLINLESTNDDPVVKSSVKGIGAVTVAARPQLAGNNSASARAHSSSTSGPGTLSHTKTNDSSSNSQTSVPSSRSMITTTVLDPSSRDEKIMYPFRVKHLGNPEVYTLYAPSASNRQEWCEAIIAAKTNHASALQAQNAEPFKLKVLADTAFGFDSSYGVSKPVIIRGTPLDRAIRQVEERYANQGRPGPVSRANVNCATVFNQPYGRLMCAVGTDYGVYISEYDNPRGWQRSIQIHRVTQISVLEEFSVFLIISDKSLIAYPLESVCSASSNPVPVANDSTRRAPQKLSGSREVNFFASGKMKDRALVLYKKKDGLSSTFKVLEPVLQKSGTTRSRFLPTSTRRGQTEFFREYDEFYIPAECYSLNLFHSSLAISTSRGVEVLTLDKKVPFSVPILRAEQPETQQRLSIIASRIKDLKPLGMFRLTETEFLVAFEECAVYVDKFGDVSRSVVMEFVGKAKSACLFGNYLILFNDDFVEIRDSMNGRMKQVIAGRDIKCLDDGGGGSGASPSIPSLGGGMNGLGVQGFGAAPRSVKFCMQHPEFERCQVVVELLEIDARQD